MKAIKNTGMRENHAASALLDRKYAQSTSGRSISHLTTPPDSRSMLIHNSTPKRLLREMALRKYPTDVTHRLAKSTCSVRFKLFRYVFNGSMNTNNTHRSLINQYPQNIYLSIGKKQNIPMDIYELRRLDFLDLKKSLGYGAYKKMAEKTNIDATYLSRCGYPEGKKNKKNIGEETVKKLDQHYPGWRRRELASMLEKAGNVEMSVDFPLNPARAAHFLTGTRIDSNKIGEKKTLYRSLPIRNVPVINKKNIIERINPAELNIENHKSWCPTKSVSAKAFALSAQELPTPNDRFGFHPSSFIIIDPDYEIETGKLVLVLDANNNLSIKRYEAIGKLNYLGSFNENYQPILLDESFQLIGRVAGSYQEF